MPNVVMEAPAIAEVLMEAPALPDLLTEAPAMPNVVMEAPVMPELLMEAPAMPDLLTDAPPMPSVVLADSAPQGPAQDGPHVTPPPAPPMQGHGPQGVRLHGHEEPSGPGTDRGMGPHGMWWKNPEIVTAIGLTTDQQKHIEDLFIQSRTQLIQLHATLETQQLQLEPVLDANPVDQPKAMAVIDKIANTRADLEKADAKMLLSIRGVLTPEQWTKLQAQHPGHGPAGQGPSGRQGPGGRKGTPPPPAE
jgi:Spy/CpxP family protein refolding chaperone